MNVTNSDIDVTVKMLLTEFHILRGNMENPLSDYEILKRKWG